MKIEKIKIEKLNPAEYNPRKDLKPGDPEYEKLKNSILTFDTLSQFFGIKGLAIL